MTEFAAMDRFPIIYNTCFNSSLILIEKQLFSIYKSWLHWSIFRTIRPKVTTKGDGHRPTHAMGALELKSFLTYCLAARHAPHFGHSWVVRVRYWTNKIHSLRAKVRFDGLLFFKAAHILNKWCGSSTGHFCLPILLNFIM